MDVKETVNYRRRKCMGVLLRIGEMNKNWCDGNNVAVLYWSFRNFASCKVIVVLVSCVM